jgi:hypothetical protein
VHGGIENIEKEISNYQKEETLWINVSGTFLERLSAIVVNILERRIP